MKTDYTRRRFLNTVGFGLSSLMAPKFNILNARESDTEISEQIPPLLQEFKNLPVTDGHFHLHGDTINTENIENLKSVMAACGVQGINIVCTTARGLLNENLQAALAKLRYPEQVFGFAGLAYHLPGVREEFINLGAQAQTLMDIGFDGFKMIEGKPSVREYTGLALDDAAYDSYYEFLETEQIPAVIHIADPWDGDKPPLEISRVYAEMENVLARFPKLNVIFAHFYFLAHQLERAGRLLDQYPNVSLDLTPGPGMYRHFSANPEKARDFFVKYQDRIVFGTDNHGEARDFGPGAPMEYWPVYKILAMRTFLETDKQFQGWHYSLQGIALEEEILRKIYTRNFHRYTGNKPRTLNTGKALEVSKQILNLAKEYAIIHNILADIRVFRSSMVNYAM